MAGAAIASNANLKTNGYSTSLVASQPMRIHYHTDCYWFGGSEIALLLHVEAAFDSADVEPIFTYRAGSEYESGLRTQASRRVQARRLRLPDPADLKQALTHGKSPRVARMLRGGVSLLPLRQLCLAWDVARMYALFRAGAPDVVHINNGGYPGAISCNAAAIAARAARVPVVVYVVNNVAMAYHRPSRLLDYPVDRLVVRSVDMFVTASMIASQALASVLRLGEGQHTVIPNAAKPGAPTVSRSDVRRDLRISDDHLVLLVMARLEKRKGHTFLLRALPRFPDDIRDKVTVLVAGVGPEHAALEAECATLRIADHVHFLGQRDDRWSLYAAADVVVLPSISHEDMPIVILDAMAAGRPVVATRVAGIPEQVVDGVTGRLVPPGDAAALAEALAAILEDPTGRAAMGKAARARYESRYTPQRFVDAYRKLYSSLLERRRPRESRNTADRRNPAASAGNRRACI
jgi:glycosyltransferase involved in cell wall biosynthesis